MSTTTANNISKYLRYELPKGRKFEQVKQKVDGMRLTEEQMRDFMAVLESEMKLGLSKSAADRKESSLTMENTFIHQTIDGTEDGDYLALDLGGTNFRVLYVQLRDGIQIDVKSHRYEIPDKILKGPGEDLFDFIAVSIARLLEDENIVSDHPIPLGFTFSFPMVQKSLNSALLLTWTKKFSCSNTVMHDVVEMLEDALHRNGGLNVHVECILNDAVGTLMTGAFEDHNCLIGMIIGTGSNASYMEDLSRVEKWEGKAPGSKEIIDIEWGAFGDNGVLDKFKLEYDFIVDRMSHHKGSFTFEKLFSGLYMGEIVRMMISDLAASGLLFTQCEDSELEWMEHKNSFPTKYVSLVEGESPTDMKQTESILREELHIKSYIRDDIAIIKYLCAIVSNRAAKIISSNLCVLLRHVRKQHVTIAVDGSLFELHPTIRPQMEKFIALMYPETETKLIRVKDGSGLGAAYVAAVADRMERQGLIDTHIHPDINSNILS